MDRDATTTRRRLAAIERLQLIERAGDPALTAVTRVVAQVTGAAAAAVHVLDDAEQHRVAAAGAPLGASPRGDSMCKLVVDEGRRIVCEDATRDARFGYSSYVRGPQPVRFFAAVPLRTAEGDVVGSLCCWDTEPRELSAAQVGCMEDLAEQVVARIELTRIAIDLGHAASHDPLTGAVNRLLLADRLAGAFARRLRRGGDVLVAVADIDGFKAVNDEHGHARGDALLVEVARRLTAATRAEDTVARHGGDEFVVVAEVEAGSVDPDDFAARLEAAFGDLPVSVSVGAVVAATGEDVAAVMRRADEAMYARKRG